MIKSNNLKNYRQTDRQTHKLNICGLQATATRYSRVFEASVP